MTNRRASRIRHFGLPSRQDSIRAGTTRTPTKHGYTRSRLVFEPLEDRRLLTVDFGARTDYSAAGLSGGATGDFNEDGIVDLVGLSASEVQFFRGQGDGTFDGTPVTTATNTNGHLEVGQFNEQVDSHWDLAILSAANDVVYFLFGDGSGSFISSAAQSVGDYPYRATVADFNDDGFSDLATANYSGGSVSVLLGSATGSFTLAGAFPAVNQAVDIDAADVNEDGILDLAVSSNSAGIVGILLGNGASGVGDGTFQNAYSVGTAASLGVNLADLDGDGWADLTGAFDGGDFLLIRRGNGDGTFQTGVSYTVGTGPYFMEAADFNGDALLDLVVSNNTAGTVSVLEGQGNLTFAALPELTVGTSPSYPQYVLPADFDGNGTLDLAVSNTGSNSLSVFHNQAAPVNPHLSLAAPATTTIGAPFSITISALDENNQPIPNFTGTVHFASSDLFAVLPADAPFEAGNDGTVTLSVTLVTVGSHTVSATLIGADPHVVGSAVVDAGVLPISFASAVSISTAGRPTATAVKDFNGDGIVDFAVGNFNAANVQIAIGNGDGSFVIQSSVLPLPDLGVYELAAGDLNGDGHVDLAAAMSRSDVIRVFFGNGKGAFNSHTDYPVGDGPLSVKLANVDSDSTLDLVVANLHESTVSVVLLPATGGPITTTMPVGTWPQHVAVGDLNGDSRNDLVTANNLAGTVSVLLQQSDGSFARSDIGVGSGPSDLVIRDFDRDTYLDLAVATYLTGEVHILKGSGSGTFAPDAVFFSDASSQIVVADDFNADGYVDLITTASGGTRVSAHAGHGDGTFESPVRFDVGQSQYRLSAADFDGNGRPDLVVANQDSNSVSVLLNAISAADPHLSLAAPATTTVDTPFSVTVSALDENNQPIPNFAGTVHFASSDPSAVLPPDMPFQAGNDGTVTASVTLLTVGSHTVTSTLIGAEPHVVGSDVVEATLVPLAMSLQATLTNSASPESLAMADLNRDGVLDLVTVNRFADSITVYRGNGDGTFADGTTMPAGGQPFDVVVRDFNGDGNFDLAVAELTSNSVGVLLGNGDGTFLPRVGYGVGLFPTSIAMGDFNADGRTDLVTANFDSGTISLLLGSTSGDGTFVAGPSYYVSQRVFAVKVADFDRDGYVDDLVASDGLYNQISVLIGTNNSSFSSPAIYAAGTYTYQVDVADYDRDGLLDVVAGNYDGDSISFFRGLGNDLFQPAVSYAVGDGPHDIENGDLNGDGFLDLAIASRLDNTVRVLLGSGNGTFSPWSQSLSAGSAPSSVVLGDFDGNGTLDLANANFTGDSVNVWLNQAAPANPHLDVAAPATTSVGSPFSVTVSALDENNQPIPNFSGTVHFASSDPFAVLPADFVFAASNDGTGTFDVVLHTSGNQTVTATLIGADPHVVGSALVDAEVLPISFAPAVSYYMNNPDSRPIATAAKDFNGDGIVDFAVGNFNAANVQIAIGNGDGSFAIQSSALPLPDLGVYELAAGDLNGDGHVDLAAAMSRSDVIRVFFGNGRGAFNSHTDYPVGDGPFSVKLADVDNDSTLDLVVANLDASSVSVVLLPATGGPITTTMPVGTWPQNVAVGDLNGDGRNDLATANNSAGTVSVLLQQLDGSFARSDYGIGNGPSDLVIGDFDRDSQMDLAVTTILTGEIRMLHGAGTGTFTLGAAFFSDASSQIVISDDFNADGNLDLITTASGGTRVSAHAGRGDGTFESPLRFDVGQSQYRLSAADFDGNGRPDLVVANQDSNSVSVLLNAISAADPHLSLAAPATTTVGTPFSITVSALDENNQPIADFAGTVHFASSDPFALLPADFTFPASNDGTGTFDVVLHTGGSHTVTATLVGANPSVVGSDVVTVSIEDVALTLNSSYAVGVNPNSAAHADFNADGLLDLAVANLGSNTVNVFLGKGDGTFANPPMTLDVGFGPATMLAEDIDLDGYADIVTADVNSHGVSVLLGNGSGGFAARAAYGSGLFTLGLAVGHMNSDGFPDLVTTNFDAGTVSILAGSASGVFTKVTEFYVSGRAAGVQVADFDDDGMDDLVTLEHYGGFISILERTGDWSFSAPVNYATGGLPYRVVVEDFDRDGALDVATSDISGDRVSVLLNGGDGQFSAAVAYDGLDGAYDLKTGDLNGDGITDLAVAVSLADQMRILLGNGDGSFIYSALVLPTDDHPVTATLGDWDGNGTLDLAATTYFGNTLEVWLNQAPATNPHLSLSAPPSASLYAPFSITVSALDENNQPIPNFAGTVHFASSDPFAVLPADFVFPASNDGTLSASVTFGTVGNHTVSAQLIGVFPRVVGSDVVAVLPNEAPELAAIGDRTIDELALISFTATATDADVPANSLTFSLSGAPAGASIDPLSGDFSWTPTEAQGPGSYTFDVMVTDDGTPSLFDSETITIDVRDGCMVLAAAQYPLDGHTRDVSGNGHHGILPGEPWNPTSTEDRKGNADRAFEFDGDDFVTLDPAPVDPATSSAGFTVMAWVKADFDNVNQSHPIVSQRKFEGRSFVPQFLLSFYGQNGNSSALFYLASTQAIPGETADDGRIAIAFPLNPTDEESWHHVAGVYDPSTQLMKLYLDGLLVAQASHAFMPSTSSSYPTRIGRTEYGDFFHGGIDEVGIFDRALTDAEVRAIATCGLAGPTINAGDDAELTEGGTFTSLAYINDPDTDAGGLMATVDYGDGSGSQAAVVNLDKTITLAHVYFDNPATPATGYTVTVSVSDGTASDNDTAFVTVANSVPAFIAPGTSATGTSGIRVGDAGNVYGIIGDYGTLDTHTVDVSWGDGTTSQAFVDQVHRTFGDLHTYTSGFDRNAPSDSLAIWKFDESSGTTVSDFARDNHGTNHGATIVPGVFGNALQFDGAHGVVVQNHYLNVGAGDFAMSAWVRPNASTHFGVIFGVYGGLPTYGMGIYADGRAMFSARDAEGDGLTVEGQASIADGDWHFVVARRVGATFDLSVDGTSVGSVTNASVGDISGMLPQYGRIGGSYTSTNFWNDPTSFDSSVYFEGTIDEVSVYAPSLANPWRSGFAVGMTLTDNDGAYSTTAVGIPIANDVSAVTDADAAPNQAPENSAIGALVGITAFASDLDLSDAVAYSLDDDAAGRFVIDSVSGVVSVAGALDYEAAASHDIVVRATSTDGSFSTATFTIAVTDVNEGLVFPGTPSDDTFEFTPAASAGQIVVKLNGVTLGTFTPTGTVTALGGGGNDKIVVNGNSAANLFEIHSDRIVLNGIDYYGIEVEVRQINALGSGDTITAFDGVATVNGGSATDTLVAGAAGPNEWLVTAQNSGVLNGGITFTSIERLIGGAGADAFRLADNVGVSAGMQGGGGNDTLDYADYSTPVSVNLQSGSATKTGGISGIEYIIGGQAMDTLTGPNSVNDWTQVTSDAGDINAVYYYEEFENLVGGNQADTFYLTGGAQMSGSLNGGGGSDTLYFLRGDSITVNLQTHTASFIGGAFSSIAQILFGWGEDTLIGPNTNANWSLSGSNAGSVAGVGFQYLEYLAGGSATDTLTGPGQVNGWNLTGPDTGESLGMAWTGMENLTGGNQTDTFFVGTGSSVSGTVSGGGGADTLDYSFYGGDVGVEMNLQSGTAIAHFTSIAKVRGSSYTDTFTGANNNNAWAFTATGGSVDGTLFDEFEKWQGGSATDTFNGEDIATVWGISELGGGSIYGVLFAGMENLVGGSQLDTFIVHSGGEVNGTINGGAGADVLDFSQSASAVVVNLETMSATVVASFSSIAQLVGSAGSDSLLGADNANTWNITGSSDGTVDSVGFSGFESLVGGSAADTFKVAPGVSFAGTIDGGGGTDKLDYTGHSLAVNVNLGAGTATGISGVAGVENVTGGNGNDTLVGSAANNVLSGGDGNDIVVGGTGDDTLSGNNGRDLVVGGSGADLVHGNATEDILIGGVAIYANEVTHVVDQPALDSIIAEWSRTDLTYAVRVAHLIGSTSGGLNGSNLLNGTTVTADGAVDILFGDAGLDWFLADDEDDVNNTGTEVVTGT